MSRPPAIQFLLIIWASPWSLLGCLIGSVAMLTGGGVQIRLGVLEFYGGILPTLLNKSPISGGAAAMTLGHTVIAQSAVDLDRCRDHEFVHVGQYERWGPFFVPAYFAASAWAWWKGLDPYLDNPFECEAYECSDPSNRMNRQ